MRESYSFLLGNGTTSHPQLLLASFPHPSHQSSNPIVFTISIIKAIRVRITSFIDATKEISIQTDDG
jgi:hypothetical protein